MKMKEKTMKCPQCQELLEIDSIRKHTNGRIRTYWECTNCKLSIMHRGEESE